MGSGAYAKLSGNKLALFSRLQNYVTEYPFFGDRMTERSVNQ
jgi:hypothetical protein